MRLKGHDVLIVPGQDHAGIATQSVVSKQLKAQGIQPSELGREKFIQKPGNGATSAVTRLSSNSGCLDVHLTGVGLASLLMMNT